MLKPAFLHGDLDKNIYMSQHTGYVDYVNPNHVCLLKKSLYGLKQSPRQWYKRFDNFVIDIGFVRSKFYSCCYMLFHYNEKSLLQATMPLVNYFLQESSRRCLCGTCKKCNSYYNVKCLL